MTRAAFIIYLLVLGILVSSPAHLFPEAKSVDIEPVVLEQSLSNSTVLAIYQDGKGFLWFGTDDGLNKYDGYTVKTYRHQPGESNSLSDDSIRMLAGDDRGNLWIATFGGGLDRFDPGRETFTHFQHQPGNPDSLDDNFVLTVHSCHDHNGADVLWIGTFKGLDRVELKTGKFSHYTFPEKNAAQTGYSRVRTLYEDGEGMLWLGTLESGLIQFNPRTGEYTRYRADPTDPNSLSHDQVLSICGGPGGVIWIGTGGGGLEKFSPKTGRFIHYPVDDSNGLANKNNIRILCPDSHGFLWLGTFGGLYCFDPEKEEFAFYPTLPAKSGSYDRSAIYSLYEDRTGLIWIGTLFRGVYKLDRQKKKFHYYTHVPDDDNSLGDNRVEAIYEDSDGMVWIGTNGGLDRWDRKTGQFTHYRGNPPDSTDPTGLSDSRVWSLYEDRPSALWIGTLDGLDRLDRKTGKISHFLAKPGDPDSLSNNRVLAVFEDRQGVPWVGTSDGLNRFDSGKGTFTQYRHDPFNADSISDNVIFSIFADRDGVLWVGTAKGLNRMNRDEQSFNSYLANPGNSSGLSNDKINCMVEDAAGMFWLGTYGGLNKFDREKNTFTSYRVKDGLPSDIILSILEDEDGNLWLGTARGLSAFSPRTLTFKNYDSGDGLQGDEFRKACWKSKSGEMFLGGVNGFNRFYPGEIVGNPYPPSVFITGFRVFNKPVTVGEEWDGVKILEKPISETREIELSYKQSALSFEYVALHYAAPESNRYAYKMEGLDVDWNYVGGQRQISYTYLKPGDYVFRVKASNNDDVWNEEGASLIVHIPPPFWKRWWFLGLIGTAFLFLVFGVIYFRTRWLREKLAEKERVQELLEKSRDEMKKSRDIAEFRGAENAKLIAAISSIFIKVDVDGIISQWNHSAASFFELPAEEAIGKPFVDALTPYMSRDRLEEVMNMGLNRIEASHNVEIEVVFKKDNDNDTRQFLATINPIIDKRGTTFGFLLLGENITRQKKEQMRMLLSQKLESLGQMSAGIAHEIRSPLQYMGDNVHFLLEAFNALIESCEQIRSCVEKAGKGEAVDLESLHRFLEESEFDFYMSEIPSSLDHVINGVTRVSNIVKSMSKLSYIGNELDEKGDLNDLVKTALVVAHNRIKNVADLETDFAEDMPPIYCAVGELSQVFLNLLINAADAIAETGRRGLIKVSTKRQDNELIVEITDDGVGIPDAIKDKIFAAFFTTKKVGHGTGQGLPFSYSIVVERHKGKLYHKSEVNRGTTFFVHLPLREEPPVPGD